MQSEPPPNSHANATTTIPPSAPRGGHHLLKSFASLLILEQAGTAIWHNYEASQLAIDIQNLLIVCSAFPISQARLLGVFPRSLGSVSSGPFTEAHEGRYGIFKNYAMVMILTAMF